MKKIALILLTMFVFAQFSFAQDVLEYMNGKEKRVIYDSQGGDNVYYFKKEGGKKHKIDKEEVFRVFRKSGDTVYVYVQDSLMENEYSANEIERMMNGQNEARKYYKPYLNLATGFCVGGVSAYAGLFWSFLPPAIYTSVLGVREANSAYFVVSDDSLYDDKFFMEGYDIGAVAKKIRYSVIGGLTGIAAGFAVFNIIIPKVEKQD